MPHSRTITSCGNSFAVCIPKEFISQLKLEKGDEVFLALNLTYSTITIFLSPGGGPK